MKKITITSVLGFIICTAFNMPIKLSTDYRDSYTGSYFCKSTCSTSRHGNSGIQTDISNDTISIVVSKDEVDSVFQIKLGTRVFKGKLLNKNLRAYPEGPHYGGNFFVSDSLEFIYSAGRASSCKYVGKKK